MVGDMEMLTNMLKAVSKMLEESKEPKVQCAKTIVDEIVANQEVENTPSPYTTTCADVDLDLEAQLAKEELQG